MSNVRRRVYTESERDAAVADVPELGVCGAARRHGIPVSCVSRWAIKAGVRRPSQWAQAKGSSVARQTDAGQRRARSAKQFAVAEQEATSGANAEVTARQQPTSNASRPQAPTESETTASGGSRVARLYTPSQKAQALEYAAEHGIAEAARHFGISRFSLYDWRRRAHKAAKGEGPAPTSGPEPQQIEQQRDREILSEWRKHPGLGPSQVVNQLRRNGVKVSVNTARRVMEDAGYRPPKVRREPHDQRYEAVRPNHLWHLDFVQRYINRQTTHTLILLDDYSRYVVGHGVDDAERAGMVIETFEQAVERHGRPERVMDDKGSAFWSWRGISRFTALLTEMGIDQIPAKHKEWNGKVENFNGNLHTELFNVHRFQDVREMRQQLAAHLDWYNHARTHHALGGLLVPADRYYGRVDEVLARIEAGAGRDAGDMMQLRQRCLELFRVTSRGGVPEIWLLGKKLLGAASRL